ncbi:MAG: hypothetical protein WD358_05225 [Nitriliruptoraceae bacterium]
MTSTERSDGPVNDGAAAAEAANPGVVATREPVVDFAGTGRRLRRMAMLAVAAIPIIWLAAGVAGPWDLSWRLLAEIAGWVVLAMSVTEVAIVGSSAVAGMLRAGERGDRLASSDVSLVPPQLRRPQR